MPVLDPCGSGTDLINASFMHVFSKPQHSVVYRSFNNCLYYFLRFFAITIVTIVYDTPNPIQIIKAPRTPSRNPILILKTPTIKPYYRSLVEPFLRAL